MSLRLLDPELDALLRAELERQHNDLELIASENYVSPQVLAVVGSALTNKYAEGLPGKRYYGGCEYVDGIEQLAILRARDVFGLHSGWGVNVQPHSGANANLALYFATLQPGDTLMGLALASGGHLTHGAAPNSSGKLYRAVSYRVGSDGRIDMNQVREIAVRERPKVLMTGASAYPRLWDFQTFREIADEVGAILVCDMAHFAGLVAAGLHPSPFDACDYVTSTTHKTLRGPRGGIGFARGDDRTKAYNSAVFPGSQGGPLMHVIAGKAVAFREADMPAFRVYAQAVLNNAHAMACRLMERGFVLVSGGTDNHLMLLDLSGRELSGKDAERVLGRAGITVNKNTVPNEQRSPFVTSGIRIGTPAMTTRGCSVEDSIRIADWIADVLTQPTDESLASRVRGEVMELMQQRPVPGHRHHDPTSDEEDCWTDSQGAGASGSGGAPGAFRGDYEDDHHD